MFTSETARRRPALDGLTGIRFIAAMAVFLFHYGAGFAASFGAPAPVTTLLSHGFLGVSLFFILSGFILTYTYWGGLRLQRRDLAAFFVARFARIYPVYALALFLMWPVIDQSLDPLTALRVLTMTQAWTSPSSALGYAWIMQAWTLSVELVFYLLFPVLLQLVARANAAALVGGAAACGASIVALAVPFCLPEASDPWTHSIVPIPAVRLIEFLYGMLLAALYLSRGWALSAAVSTLLQALAVCAIVGLLGFFTEPRAAAAAVALFGPLVVLLTDGRTALAKLLGSRPMLLLGGASYTLYLAQLPIREWLRPLPGETLERVLNPVVAIAFSIAVFLIWEEPMRARVRALFRRRGSENFIPNL